MKTQRETIRLALIDFLSGQPDRTALNRDCKRVVHEAVGKTLAHGTIDQVARELGITRRAGSLSGELGDTFVTYWTLPEAQSNRVTAADRCLVQDLVTALAGNDGAGVATGLEYGVKRPRQVILALAELAVER